MRNNLRLLPNREIKSSGLTLTGAAKKYNFLVFGKKRSGSTEIMKQSAAQLLDQGEKVVFFGQLPQVLTTGLYDSTRDLFFDPAICDSIQWQVLDDIETAADIRVLEQAVIADNPALRLLASEHYSHEVSLRIGDLLANSDLSNVSLREAVGSIPVGIGQESTKLAANIRHQADSFQPLDNMGSGFSCKEWVAGKEGGGLFILGDYATGSKPAALFCDMLLHCLAQRAEGKHIYIFIEGLHQIPRLTMLLAALSLSTAHDFSVWLSVPSADLLAAKYGNHGIRQIFDECSGVVSTSVDMETAEFIRSSCGDEMAGMDTLEPGRGAVYLRHARSIEIQEVTI